MKARILTSKIEGETMTRPQIIGTVKIGFKDPEKGFPKSVDYFIMDSGDGIKKAFTEAYGDKPKELVLFFPQDEDENIMRHYYEFRKDKAVWAQGDGMSFNYHDSAKPTAGLNTSIKFESEETAKKWMEDFEARTGAKRKERLEIYFMIPKIKGFFGRFRFATGGVKSSIQNLLSCIDLIKAQSKGRIAGCPFKLVVEKVNTTVAEAGKNQAKNFVTVNMYPAISDEIIYDLEQFGNIKGMITQEKVTASKLISAPIPETPKEETGIETVEHEEVLENEFVPPVSHLEATNRLEAIFKTISTTKSKMDLGRVMMETFGTMKWEEIINKDLKELSTGLQKLTI